MLPSAVVALAAIAARPPMYGGEVVNYVYQTRIEPDPALARTAADAAAHAAVYERLYDPAAAGLLPVLARERPAVDGATVIVPLRRGVVLHDGTPFDPRLAAEALARLDGDHPGAYVLAAVRRRQGRPLIQPVEESFAVRIELLHPDPDFPSLLAADHARLAWPRAGLEPPLIGTGAFSWRSGREQQPFLRHRGGRPFVERLIWRPYASRFGAGALAERGQAAVFGGPPASRVLEGPGTWLVLQVGETVGDEPTRARIQGKIHAALQRDRLVRRFLGPEGQVATGFVADPALPGAAAGEVRRPLELLALRGLRFGHRLVERIQLDLFRAGLRAQIEWLDPTTFAARGQGGFDLRLLELRPGVIDDGSTRAALHRVLSVAADLGGTDVIEPERLARFATADEAGRRRELVAIDRRLRRTHGIIVVGRTAPALAVPPAWPPLAGGAVDWPNLVLEAAP